LPAAGSWKPSRRARDAVPMVITSDIMLETRNAVVLLMTCRGFGSCWKTTVPSRSSTRRIRIGSTTCPSLANAVNAPVMEITVTSPEPSASEGTFGSAPTPMSCA
jgi:hypothetical protein